MQSIHGSAFSVFHVAAERVPAAAKEFADRGLQMNTFIWQLDADAAVAAAPVVAEAGRGASRAALTGAVKSLESGIISGGLAVRRFIDHVHLQSILRQAELCSTYFRINKNYPVNFDHAFKHCICINDSIIVSLYNCIIPKNGKK
jgi:hypothetical protein